jgi:hypothetical protein
MLEPSGPVQAYNGISLPLLLPFTFSFMWTRNLVLHFEPQKTHVILIQIRRHTSLRHVYYLLLSYPIKLFSLI